MKGTHASITRPSSQLIIRAVISNAMPGKMDQGWLVIVVHIVQEFGYKPDIL